MKQSLSRKRPKYTPEEFISRWFVKKGENPEDAGTIARQLKLNSLELYTQTERFIFELLQNADDMPASNKTVDVSLEMLDDYFLFIHNGKQFDQRDIESIADAAKSSKSRDKTKTGYKGIGFKSVFTDSTCVYIKSGDFSFKFDKLHPIYKNFWELYSGYLKKLSLEEQENTRLEYEGREEDYIDINQIPWQIKPIWVKDTDYPIELKGSRFHEKHNVAIALQIGAHLFKEKQYADKVMSLVQEPRFLIFLRHINNLSFAYNGKQHSLQVERKKDFLTVSQNEKFVATYLKSNYSVNITNDSFKEAGLNFEKKEIDGKIHFIDSEGIKIEDIPEKLTLLDKTVISFAAKLKDGIKSLNKEESIIFNYLPTSDKKYEFPFLVNGDFVTNTNREYILYENVWNQYLFFQIGYLHVKWAENLIDFGKFQHVISTYLNILYEKFKNTNDVHLSKINTAFNNGFKKGIEEFNFILNDESKNVNPRDIIIDNTGLSGALGNEAFYKLFGNDKRLPDTRIDIKVLRREVFGIEKMDMKKLAERLKSSEGKKVFEKIIEELDEKSHQRFLNWLDNVLSNSDNVSLLETIVNKYDLFQFQQENNEMVLSNWEGIKDGNEYLVLNEKTFPLGEILFEIGFQISTFSISDFSNIKKTLNQVNTYLASDLTLFKIICAKTPDNSLNSTKKIKLFEFAKKLFQVGLKVNTDLLLFKDINGKVNPIAKLIEHSDTIRESWLQGYKIDKKEGDALQKTSSDLCNSKNIYSRLIYDDNILKEIKKDINSENVKEFYNSIQAYYLSDTDPLKKRLKDREIIFVDDESRFKNLQELYYSKTLNEEKNISNYSGIKICIESITGLILPHKNAISFIHKHGLTTHTPSISANVKYEATLYYEDVKAFLEFITNVETKEDLLLKGYFREEVNIIKFINKAAWQYKSKKSPLIEFIVGQGIGNFKRLPRSLEGIKKLEEIGLFQGEHLLKKAIIELPFDLSLVSFMSKQEIPERKEWLNKLDRFELSSTQQYSSKSNEHKLLKLALSIIEEYPSIFEEFREKIKVDGKKLTDIAVSDLIKRTYENKIYHFSLAELLPEYEGRSNVISTLIDNFIDFKSKKNDLINKAFKLTNQESSEIIYKLKERSETITKPSQMIFIALVQQGDLNGFNVKVDYGELLTYCYDNSTEYGHNYPPLKLVKKYIPGFDLENKLYKESLAYGSEKLEDWIRVWINNEAERWNFLQNFGLKTLTSNIVSIRNFFLDDKKIDKKIPEEAIINLKVNRPDFLKNTFHWIAEKSIINQNSIANLSCITYILQNLTPDKSLPIPALKKMNNRYEMTYVEEASKLYFKETIAEKYKEKIIDIIFKDDDLILVDNTIPENWRIKFGVEDIDTVPLNNEEILEVAVPYKGEPYYSWEYRTEFPVRLLDGNVPKIVKFNEVQIDSFQEEAFIYLKGIFYVNKQHIDDLETFFKGIVPSDKLLELMYLGKRKGKTEDSLDLTEEEIAALRRIFGNNLPESAWMNTNVAAQIKGLEYLTSLGYDTEQAEKDLPDNYSTSRLKPISKNGKNYQVLCKSAKGGLLYLKASTWNELEKEDFLLYILLGKDYSDCKLCADKKELLYEYSDYFVMRLEGESDPVVLDNALAGAMDYSKMQLLFRMKKKKGFDSIFEKIREKEQDDDYSNFNADPNIDA